MRIRRKESLILYVFKEICNFVILWFNRYGKLEFIGEDEERGKQVDFKCNIILMLSFSFSFSFSYFMPIGGGYDFNEFYDIL